LVSFSIKVNDNSIKVNGYINLSIFRRLPTAIYIQSRRMAEQYRKFFEDLWKHAGY